MKKARIICMSLIAFGFAFLATSCNKDNDTKNDTLTITAATFEVEDGDRMYIDFEIRKTLWNAYDEVMVYNVDLDHPGASITSVFSTDASAEGQYVAHFSGSPLGPKKDKFYFFYPASMASGELNNNHETFTVGNEQHYTMMTSASGNPMATVEPGAIAQATSSDNLDFQMQHIFGCARFLLTGPGRTVDHIVLEDKQLQLTGECTLSIPAVTEHFADLGIYIDNYRRGRISYVEMYNYLKGVLDYSSNPNGRVITLDCSSYSYAGTTYNGVELNKNNSNNPEVFVIGLRPAALSMGWTLTVYFTDNTYVVVDDTDIDDVDEPLEFCIRPGKWKNIEPPTLNTFNYPADRWGTWE